MDSVAANRLKIEQPAAAMPEKTSDHALLAATLEGDETAFAELVGRYQNQIVNFLFRMLDDYDEAVDLAQETFVRIYGAAERYHSGYAFSTYIYRIAANLAISELRRRRRRRLISLSSLFVSPDGEESSEIQLIDPKQLHDQDFVESEQQRIVRRAIATLPERYRAPLVLRDVEDRTYEEIAEILGANTGTIKSRISRGRALLREKLKGYFEKRDETNCL